MQVGEGGKETGALTDLDDSASTIGRGVEHRVFRQLMDPWPLPWATKDGVEYRKASVERKQRRNTDGLGRMRWQRRRPRQTIIAIAEGPDPDRC